MKTSILLFAVAALLALGAGQAVAQNPAPASATVTVAMKDPGCHWFAVGGKYLTKLTVKGPIRLANYDEAALVIASNAGVKHEAIGKKLALGPGVYRITMVGQASDDNHLKLVVK